MHRRLRLLVQRACAPGVLDSAQLGVTVHALHQLETLQLQDAAVLQLIRDHIGSADARTQANVFHALARQTRTSFDVRVALPETVEATLRDVQEELSESVDQLSAPEAILAMEAVMKLLPFGGVRSHMGHDGADRGRRGGGSGGVVDGLLLRELQDRSLALTSAVERPVELIGIARVIMEGLQSPLLQSGDADVGDDAGEDLGELLLSGGGAGLSGGRGVGGQGGLYPNTSSTQGEAVGAQWGASVLRPLLNVLETRVQDWGTQDLMSLLDVLVLRGGRGSRGDDEAAEHAMTATSSSSTLARDGPPHHPRGRRGQLATRDALVLDQLSPSATVPDLCRPFVGRLLTERLAPSVAELTPSQCAAWLLRLVRLGYHREAQSGAYKQLVLRLIARLAESETRSAMSASQLSTCACAIAAVLIEEVQSNGSLTGPASARAPSTVSFTTTESDDCLRTFVLVFAALGANLDRRYGRGTDLCHSDDAAVAAVTHVLPVLVSLPEVALLACATRGVRDADAARGHAFRAVASGFPGALTWGCSFMLRHFVSLLPRERVQAACVALHWNVYGTAAAGSSSGSSGGGGASATDTHSAGGVGSGLITAPALLTALVRTGEDAAAAAARSARQLVALCGLVQQSLPLLNTLDCLQILNEATTAMYASRGAAPTHSVGAPLLATRNRNSGGPADAHEETIYQGMDSTAAMRVLLQSLHDTLQASFSSEQGRPTRARSTTSASPGQAPLLLEVPTSALVRYLTSMSKLGVRARSPYYGILDTLQTRSLTTFESIAVLGVMSRHHLHRPSIVKGVVRRLPELTEGEAPGTAVSVGSGSGALHPSQKAILLKYLGQAGAQRFVRAPSSPYFDAGAFFTSAEEVQRLSFLELIFVVNGLTALRQYASPTLTCALAAMASSVSSRATDTGKGPSSAAATATVSSYARALAGVRSATTQAELLSALVRLGPQLVPLALLEATADSLRHALMQSRSLFVDVARLADMWALLPAFLSAATVNGHDEASQSSSSASSAAAAVASATAALDALQSTAAVLVRARLLDIADPSTLRSNSFLFGQLASGVDVGGRYLPPTSRGADTFRLTLNDDVTSATASPHRSALPADTSEALDVLVRNMDLDHLNAVLSNPAQLVDCATVGLFLLTVMDHASPPRLLFKPSAMTVVRFVRKHAEALRVKDALLIWSLVDELLSNESAPSAAPETSRAARVRLAWSDASHQDIVPLLRGLREACRAHVIDEKSLPKLSPTEKRLLETQLS